MKILQKIPEEKNLMEKIYHIYAKDTCLYHSLTEEEFKNTWKQLKTMVGLMKTDYSPVDLTYEELLLNREMISNSSH